MAMPEIKNVGSIGSMTINGAHTTSWIESPAVINVQHFGAVGDGITDDTAAIQAAYAAAEALGANVVFPTGNYVFRPEELALWEQL